MLMKKFIPSFFGVLLAASLGGCVEEKPAAETQAVNEPAAPAGSPEKQAEPVDSNAVLISVSPTVNRVIEGVGELNRNIYFALSDHGTDFRQRCRLDERYNYLKEHQITFGRRLGPVESVVKWTKAVKEDPARPGHADLALLKSELQKGVKAPDQQMVDDFGKLQVAAHGNHNAFPEFMGQYTTEESQKGGHPEHIPVNADAAAELAAYVMAYGYNDFDRPAYYEPLNEPHWSFFGDPKLHDWHLKTMEKVHELAPGVKVGGPCQSVSYMYAHDYGTFRGWCKFLDGTEGKMDFYSFHCYDYFGEVNGDFGGRITSGLPLEGVLDMVPNYMMNHYGKTYDIIISEHGGYELKEGLFTDKIAKEKIPGEGFEWEMKKRSVADYNAVTTFIANTLGFMNHPHVVKKAVPFILLESMAWDPRYYATLYAPNNFEDQNDWVMGKLIYFYKFFRDFKGRYVKIQNPNSDIQALALVDGSKLFVVLNNLSKEEYPLAFDLENAPFMGIRRFGRNADFTPYLDEQPVKSLSGLKLKGRESMMLMLDYTKTLHENHPRGSNH